MLHQEHKLLTIFTICCILTVGTKFKFYATFITGTADKHDNNKSKFVSKVCLSMLVSVVKVDVTMLEVTNKQGRLVAEL